MCPTKTNRQQQPQRQQALRCNMLISTRDTHLLVSLLRHDIKTKGGKEEIVSVFLITFMPSVVRSVFRCWLLFLRLLYSSGEVIVWTCSSTSYQISHIFSIVGSRRQWLNPRGNFNHRHPPFSLFRFFFF